MEIVVVIFLAWIAPRDGEVKKCFPAQSMTTKSRLRESIGQWTCFWGSESPGSGEPVGLLVLLYNMSPQFRASGGPGLLGV